MYKMVVVLFFLLLHGCGLNSLFVADEVDKVTIVKYTPYMKHNRAYFTRTALKVMKDDKNYLYLYHEEENELGILLHRKNQYILYNLSNPEKQALALNATPKTKFSHVVKKFKRKGYRTIDSLEAVGYMASVSLRRYKGVKTLLVDVKDYSRLQDLYKHAIATYDATKIKNIKTTLPRSLIYDDYMHYEKLATTPAQIEQLQIIAKKLKLPTASIKKYAPYAYYLHESSLDELSAYLSQRSTRDMLSYQQYNMLKQRKTDLEEENLFNEGSLEDLIAAYKINKNPKYKERILILMKESQNTP
ncbi:hypothetical protein [Sulfurovum sp.]|uniref:hypothetical protein n=1 Tax=Sulfurovum sp. TaxID=1969726 RepID=UPI0035699552